MGADRDYMLGTHDDEITRLGLQHAVWRPRALDAWRRAGVTRNHRVIDYGAGPGFASLDLADIVGPGGEVLALERSARFLEHLSAAARARGAAQIHPVEIDLCEHPLEMSPVDAAWCRWVFAFLPDPKGALQRLLEVIRPGGVVVIHEYLDYGSWRMSPRIPSFDAFVQAVMASWRASGGEPDIGLDLPRWLEEAGMRLESLTPIVDMIDRSNFVWAWPERFVEVNLSRLVELGMMPRELAEDVRTDFEAACADHRTRMITPLVVEIIARRPFGPYSGFRRSGNRFG